MRKFFKPRAPRARARYNIIDALGFRVEFFHWASVKAESSFNRYADRKWELTIKLLPYLDLSIIRD